MTFEFWKRRGGRSI